jgi:hypothetical protein
VCYCLKAWLELPASLRAGNRPSRDDALKVWGAWGAVVCVYAAGGVLATCRRETCREFQSCICPTSMMICPTHLPTHAHPCTRAQAMAVIDRIRRMLASISDAISSTLEPISTAFGTALGCESWAVQLFAEEVVRGGPAFAVSLVLSR